MEMKTKINKWDLIKSFCTEKEGSHEQNEKTTHRTGETICKQSNQQGISPQNQLTQLYVKKQTSKQNPIKNGQKF